jgi:hypothetical protein
MLSQTIDNNLTITYLIQLLNDQTNIKIDKKKYLIDSYPTVNFKFGLTYDNLLTSLLYGCKNIQEEITNQSFEISISLDKIKYYKNEICKFIKESKIIDIGKQKKYISYINSINNLNTPTNESILLLTYYFGINLIIYNSESQIIKCYYYEDKLIKEQPFILIKETKDTNSPNFYYELVFSQKIYIFSFYHPIIIEIFNSNIFIIGLEHSKKLEYKNNQSNQSNLEFISIIEDTPIKLKLVSKKILKKIEEFKKMNFDL